MDAIQAVGISPTEISHTLMQLMAAKLKPVHAGADHYLGVYSLPRHDPSEWQEICHGSQHRRVQGADAPRIPAGLFGDS